MHKIASDTELLRASLAGSAEAFGVIIERYQAVVCAITYSAAGDLAESEELAQQTFANAWQGLSRLKNSAGFRAWLCTIARNVARKSIKTSHKDIISNAQSLDEVGLAVTAEPDPSRIAISKEEQNFSGMHYNRYHSSIVNLWYFFTDSSNLSNM